MSYVVELALFKLKEGVREEDFLHVSDKFQKGFIKLQKGYIKRELLVSGQTWADYIVWETMEDAQNAAAAFRTDKYAIEYMGCFQQSSVSLNHYLVLSNV